MIEICDLAAGSRPRLAAQAGGGFLFSVDLSARECDGHVIVALRGELDILDAAGVAGGRAGPERHERPR
jgi:hypothetical protein